ncbi:DNA-3-methyladenine glycosylase [Senegalia massiliensis]|uniref:Putative 3-methyladenine DNA glycosylase n=1 Tax=Senegalia massiliensis TaxID=1720316 RepID=A0A845R2B4_9CLOT|nr:DNA-3-methyladenine glycosylase [Senegalia massiliensis]NBI08119.1 DNA-3-methyladenine glycosylase [Senegalia massiliensis]
MHKLNRKFYRKSALDLSKDLLGKYLVLNKNNKKFISKIVEVEAYMGEDDKASHTYKNRRTKRTETMFKDAGHAYVYLIYGIYNCLNVVSGGKNIPQGVLLRGVQPINELDTISLNRFGKMYNELTKKQIKNLTNGPGKLTQALGITRDINGYDLTGDVIYICEGEKEQFEIIESKRIGINYAEEAKDFLWRFYIDDSDYVSRR